MVARNVPNLDFSLFDEDSKAAIAAACKRYSATRISAVRPVATGVTDRDLVEEFDVTVKALVSLIGVEAAQEFADYARANAAEDRNNAAADIPRPSRIVMSRSGTPPEQKVLRSHLAKLIFVCRGVAGIASGFVTKRLRGLTYLPSTPVKLDIQRRCDCPACGQEGNLVIQGMQEHTFRCACGHQEGMGQCRCDYCMTALLELALELRRVVAERVQAVASLSSDWREAVDQRIADAFQSDKSMRRDFELRKNDPGRSLRQVLKMNPADVDDFQSCVEKVAAHWKSPSEAKMEVKRIWKEAESCKVVYKARGPVAPDSWDFLTLVAMSEPIRRARWEHDVSSEHDLADQMMTLLTQAPIPELGKALHVGPDCISLETSKWKVPVYVATRTYWHSLLEAEVLLTPGDWDYLNPYFLNCAEPADRGASTSTGAPLFKSTTESNAFARICGENPGALVIPNRLLRQVVGFERLRGLKGRFSSKDYADLWKFELDFAVYSDTGVLLFVEEVQRGEHHDKPEWIRKDALKREALKAAGVVLRESF
ncbi:hypothetical protein [Ralstonia pseudosolanacearum]|uniref:hypothetical protein n=1 Tax=Ralstonia pseudosolanacearum TaxID=1310165 RepID=UPI0002C09C7C|nr:hypothetical protein [Ralstonia pseudosolanacearum]AGH85393.1 hypothetical protein F504_2882 [Ralstonia pseudosolanacearum FQY_4]ANH31781.1 hypothetical protein A3768_0604 [Ralstonia solanacearum]